MVECALPLVRHQALSTVGDVMEAKRFRSILNYGNVFFAANSGRNGTGACFNTTNFVEQLETAFHDKNSATILVPYGLGQYNTLQEIAEYVGVVTPVLGHDWWWLGNSSTDPTKRARLDVSDDGRVWYTGATNSGSFLRGRDPYVDNYMENSHIYDDCNVRFSKVLVAPTEGLRNVVEELMQIAQLSKRWGITDTCK